MITNFIMDNVDAKIEEMDSLINQRFPKLNVSIDNVEDKKDIISISYTFLADYRDGDVDSAKEIGHIKMSGTIELSEDKEKKGEAMKQWKTKSSLPTVMAEEIINSINFRCSATGTLIAYSLGFIPPLVISQTKVSEPKEGSGK